MECRSKFTVKKGTPEEQSVPCGRCPICKSKTRQHWIMRLKEERRASENGYFVTLTYDQEHQPHLSPNGELCNVAEDSPTCYGCEGTPTLWNNHMSEFIKHLRTYQEREYVKMRKQGIRIERWKIRFYGVGEYGELTNRPHYHILIFNMYDSLKARLNSMPDPKTKKWSNIWNKGIVTCELVTDKRIGYVTKYMMDKDQYPKGAMRPQVRQSQGIGKQYIDRAKDWHLENEKLYTISGGSRASLHRYYKDKIFAENPEALERARMDSVKATSKKDKTNPDATFLERLDTDRAQRDQEHYSIKVRSKKRKL